MNYHIICLKCPPLADTRLQWLAVVFHRGDKMAFSGKAYQINRSAFSNSGTIFASTAACNKTPALSPNVIIQWTEVWLTEGHSLLPMKSWQFDWVKI